MRRKSCPCAGMPTFTCPRCGARGLADEPRAYRGHTIVRDASGCYHASRDNVRIASNSDLNALRRDLEAIT